MIMLSLWTKPLVVPPGTKDEFSAKARGVLGVDGV
jgi:hypothetical protein